MTTTPINVIPLFSELKKNMDEGAAITLCQAFENLHIEKLATKEDLKIYATKEDLKMYATKDDLKMYATKEQLHQFQLAIYQHISTAKWQVIGSVCVMMFAELILKHFGW